MFYIAAVVKFLQIASTSLLMEWAFLFELMGGDFGAVGQFIVLLCVVLLALGQLLSGRVYKLLGVDGVYYGAQFGKKVEWVTEWPYGKSKMSHPMYVGCMLTLAGAAPFMPIDLALFWIANYAYLMVLESSEPSEDVHKASRQD